MALGPMAQAGQSLIPLLQARGLHVVAVQNPLRSIADDVTSTNRLINAQDGPVFSSVTPTRGHPRSRHESRGYRIRLCRGIRSQQGRRTERFGWPIPQATCFQRDQRWISYADGQRRNGEFQARPFGRGPGSRTRNPGCDARSSTSSSSTSLAICRSRRPAANCCSIWSAGSTSAPRSSSPPISPSVNGRPCLAIRK
jgi:hypothetical protein